MLHCNVYCATTEQKYDLIFQHEELENHIILNNLAIENKSFACQFIGYKILEKISKEFTSLKLSFTQLSNLESLNLVKYNQLLNLKIDGINYQINLGSDNNDALQTFVQLLDNHKQQLKLPRVAIMGGTRHRIEFLRQMHNIAINEYLTVINEKQSCLAIKLNINNNQFTLYLSRSLLQYLIQYCLNINYLHKIDFDNFHNERIATIVASYIAFKTNLSINLVNYSMTKVNNQELAVIRINNEMLSGGELFIDGISLSKFAQLINYTQSNKVKNISNAESLNLEVNFPLEVGVSYLSVKDIENIACGDIIFFDKYCEQNVNLTQAVLAITSNHNFTLDLNNGKIVSYSSNW